MKQTKDWLGHSTFAATADIYSHLDFNSKQELSEAICGYGTATMNRWFRFGHLKGAAYYGVNLISKESLEEFCVAQQNSGMALGSMSL